MSNFGFSKLGFKRVKVSGSSMDPTYSDGDVLLVRWFSQSPIDIALRTVIVIERDEMPGVFLIKRLQKSHNGLYWVEGDNRQSEKQELMNDSRKWGYINAHEVRGKILFRLRKSSGRKLQR
ncbi:MAG: S26 family signal peptidase [Candidatus Nanopelagicaceae bacterium]|nr:S26 family signal peptidase [Candidatus Nanopelagicaceae bacterium]